MQKTVYKCDQCLKEIGAKKHISLHFDRFSGIAVPPSTDEMVKFEKGFSNVWKVESSLQGEFVHFCNSICIQRYFSNLLKITK